MTNTKKSVVGPKSPPDVAFTGTQISLFQEFLCNTQDERDRLSNTIEIWDSLPKYSATQQAMNLSRTKEGLLPRFERTCIHKKREYRIRVTPAIVDCEGVEKAFYPSANEEIIEDALRKIAAEQYQGFYEHPDQISGVVFSLNMLRKELRRRGHTRSYQEIIRSLHILAGSNIEIELADGKGFAKANYLPSLTVVSRKEWQEDPEARWIAHFHPLVTRSITAVSYRQYNYHIMMSHRTQLSRWLHKKLSHNYVNAALTVPYRTSLTAVRRDSGLLECKRVNDDVRKLEFSLAELVTHQVLVIFTKDEKRAERRKILDIDYLLTAHPRFVQEVKAANKRQQLSTSAPT